MEMEPNLVTSHHSGVVMQDGMRVWLEIYRLEDETEWTLEVVNESGTSIVWDNRFASSDAAFSAFRAVLDMEGIDAFEEKRTVIRFPKH